MKKILLVPVAGLLLFTLANCSNKKHNLSSKKETVTDTLPVTAIIDTGTTKIPVKDLASFLPRGYVMFDTITGDLNKDGVEDCILMIKGTDKTKIIDHEYRGRLDRNRRGIIVLLNNNNGYEVAVKNYDCFSSENEEGGVYYAPELDIEVNKGNLLVNYRHGRYGYWFYTFRLKNNDMELIGYDASSSNGPVIDKETSINFLTGKKQVKKNTNDDAESGEEVFKESWHIIKNKTIILLSEIKDFDELNMYDL